MEVGEWVTTMGFMVIPTDQPNRVPAEAQWFDTFWWVLNGE